MSVTSVYAVSILTCHLRFEILRRTQDTDSTLRSANQNPPVSLHDSGQIGLTQTNQVPEITRKTKRALFLIHKTKLSLRLGWDSNG